MSRAKSLLSMWCWLLLLPAPVLAQRKDDDVRFRAGNIKVTHRTVPRAKGDSLGYNVLQRDGIHFGLCFTDAEHRRLPATYYHPHGPLGIVLQKCNWFPGPVNTYDADARLPAALVGLGAAQSPLAQLTALWSEPPLAIIGLEAGTAVSYARPFQYCDIFEPTKELIDLHERTEEPRFFHFVADARRRGTALSIVHGAPRQLLKQRGPRNFYHVIVMEACSGENGEKIFLDLFTREGIAQCMERLVEDGVLCVHTSHRFLELPKVLAAIGGDLKLHVRVGHDQAPDARFDRGDVTEMFHFTSEWVMIARQKETLDAVCKTPANYAEKVKERGFGSDQYWTSPKPLDQVWTDKGPNLLHGVLRGHPFAMRYTAVAEPLLEFVGSTARSLGLGPKTQQFLRDFYYLPRPVDRWLVQSQLKNNPEVEKLWP